MNRLLLTFAAAAYALTLSAQGEVLFRADQGDTPSQAMTEKALAAEIKKVSKKLALSEDQQTEVARLYTNANNQLKELDKQRTQGGGRMGGMMGGMMPGGMPGAGAARPQGAPAQGGQAAAGAARPQGMPGGMGGMMGGRFGGMQSPKARIEEERDNAVKAILDEKQLKKYERYLKVKAANSGGGMGMGMAF